MDANPLGKSLIHERSWGLLVNEERTGIRNSKKKAIKLAINRFLATLDFQEAVIAPIAEITIINPMQSRISEISENTILLSEAPRIPFK